jgi:hypothetical protein
MEGPCTTTATLLIDITNVHALITVCQKRWGVIGGQLMSAAVERSTAFVGSQYSTVDEPEEGMGLSCTRHSLSALKVLSASLRGKCRDAR